MSELKVSDEKKGQNSFFFKFHGRKIFFKNAIIFKNYIKRYKRAPTQVARQKKKQASIIFYNARHS